MKTIFAATLTVLLVGAGLGFSQGQGTTDTAKRLEVVENDLVTTRQKTEMLSAELLETQAVLAKTLQYLEAQAKSASTMSGTLDESERAGFTYGINAESRQILLRGWHEQLAAQQTELPTMVTKPKVADVKTK